MDQTPNWHNNGIDDDDPFAQSHPSIPLEPLTPEEAMDIHMARMREDGANWTERSHKSRLSWWLQWCELEGIDNLNDLTGRDILRYRDWRRFQNGKDPEDVPIARSTLKTALDTLRVYLRHAAQVNAVHPILPEQVDPPTLSKEDAREVHISADRAHEILDFLRKYHYGSLSHVGFELLWHTGMRMGAARSIDLRDCHLDENPYIKLHHRPESDTPLKNKGDSERPVAISDGVARLLRDWKDDRRPEVEDEYGREALMTTVQGRVSRTTIRNNVYAVTRPCFVTDKCPHDRDPATCEATQRKQFASKCPGSVSPHAIRRSAITHWLDKDWRRDHVSERANVSEKVIEEHYDEREDLRRMEQRRRYLEDI